MGHKCHIPECGTRVPPTMLICRKHWDQVPNNLRAEVYRTYRPGQCSSGRPSVEWLKAARYAINAVTGMGVQWPDPIPGYEPAESGKESGR